MKTTTAMMNEDLWARLCGVSALLLVAICLALMGCEHREKVLEVNTPGGSVEINKATEPDGSVKIEVDADKQH